MSGDWPVVCTCPDCGQKWERWARRGRPGRCPACSDANAKAKSADRGRRFRAANAKSCTCRDCGAKWERGKGERAAICRPCRATRDRRKDAAKKARRRALVAAVRRTQPPVPRPVLVTVRRALVNDLNTGRELRRTVSVLSSPYVVDHILGLRLVRVHVWGEVEPRAIAVERLEEAASAASTAARGRRALCSKWITSSRSHAAARTSR